MMRMMIGMSGIHSQVCYSGQVCYRARCVTKQLDKRDGDGNERDAQHLSHLDALALLRDRVRVAQTDLDRRSVQHLSTVTCPLKTPWTPTVFGTGSLFQRAAALRGR